MRDGAITLRWVGDVVPSMQAKDDADQLLIATCRVPIAVGNDPQKLRRSFFQQQLLDTCYVKLRHSMEGWIFDLRDLDRIARCGVIAFHVAMEKIRGITEYLFP